MPQDAEPSTDLAEPLPERLGVYRIESQLGRGGMGEVYLAWDELLERHVAIKRIHADKLQDSIHRARFLREARAVARLDHPAIVRVYHVLERADGDCLVMEYVRGRDLAKLLAEERLALPRVLAIGREIALGLAEAHAHGLVHRDLKPANVMVVQNAADTGAGERVKILDFGLAKPIWEQPQGPGESSEDSSLTRSGVIIGTVLAMSPEQASGEPVDHRTDLFALGGLLYELATGQTPFRGKTLIDTLRKVVAEKPQPIAELVPGIPFELEALVGSLLAKQPADRPASARIVAARLAEIAARLNEGSRRSPFVIEAASSTAGFAEPDMPTAEHASPTLPPLGAPSTESSSLVIRTLVHAELVKSDSGPALATAVQQREVHALLERFHGSEVDTARGWLLLFERPAEAVAFALAYHRQLAQAPGELRARIGIHLGEVLLRRGSRSRLSLEGAACELAALLAARANGRQTLLSRSAFDLARGAVAPVELTDPEIRWLAHGTYRFGGLDEAVEVFEVGIAGFSPLAEPPESTQTHRAVAHGDELALGWRPAVGQPVPRRANWELSERLGEGGFGEVWLARHKSGEERVFKFCFEAERLRALKREVTLFRLLGETLGHRRDIARVLDWDFEAAPYFLEAEYTDGGDLVSWAERCGGLAAVPLATRLELVAQVAEALAAAHSVGILHKDVKPRNVLIATDTDGRPQARLTDFGIGLLTDRSRLREPGFTVLGFTETGLGNEATPGGTVRYMAPELLEGKPATIQGDVYSLGVVLYQIVVGDFGRTLARGWRRDIADELLADDIAACVDGEPARRPASALEVAERLRGLERRHREHEAEELARTAQARALRRRRLAASLGIAAAVMLLVISVFAYQTLQAKNRELEARRNAEQRRQQAEKLIDFLLGDLRDQLQPIGKLDILDKVGDQAMEYFAAVPASELSSEEMRNYSKALYQIGQVRFALGKFPEASRAFEQSLVMAQRLVALDPQNVEWQLELGQSHYWMGYLHWKKRDFEDALAQFEAYRNVSEQLVARDPENASWQQELAYSHSNIGSVFEEQGRLVEAARSLEAAARIFENLSLRSPTDLGLGVELARLYAKLGSVLRNRGELGQARGRFDASLDLLLRAAAARPDDMELHASVSTAFFHVGTILLEQGETTLALEHFRSSLERSRLLVAHDPEHRLWLTSLTNALDMNAMVLLVLGDFDEAETMLEEEYALNQKLIAQAPEFQPWRLAQARYLELRSELRLLRGRAQGVRDSLETARRLLRRLVDENTSFHYRRWLTRTVEKLGEIYRDEGATERAGEAWGEGLEIARQLVAAEPSPEHLEWLVRMLVLNGEHDAATPHIERLAAIGYRKLAYRAFLDRHHAG